MVINSRKWVTMRKASSGDFRNQRCHRSLVLAVLFALSLAAPSLASSESAKQWEHLQKVGTEALDTNRYWIAEPTLKQALVKAGSFGNADLRLAKSLGELGRLYTVRGRFEEAEPYLEEELHVKEEALGKSNGQTIPAMGSLIRFYLQYGTAAKAYPLTQQMLAFVEGKLNEPVADPQVITKHKKGEPLEAWAGTADMAMRDPLVEWAITCDAVGNAYRAKGNFDVADRCFKAALDMKETVLGKGHLSLANSYDNLGMLYQQKNEDKEAESYFRDALATTEKTLPPESPEVYARLEKLAKCLVKEKKYDKAEELYLRAPELWKTQPSKSGDEVRALFALGCMYIDQKKYSSAIPVLQRALNHAERINGPASISLVPYLEKMAYAYYYLGRKSDGEYLKARANTISGDTQ